MLRGDVSDRHCDLRDISDAVEILDSLYILVGYIIGGIGLLAVYRDIDNARAHIFYHADDIITSAVAECYYCNNRRDADNYAEHSQKRTHEVCLNRKYRYFDVFFYIHL